MRRDVRADVCGDPRLGVIVSRSQREHLENSGAGIGQVHVQMGNTLVSLFLKNGRPADRQQSVQTENWQTAQCGSSADVAARGTAKQFNRINKERQVGRRITAGTTTIHDRDEFAVVRKRSVVFRRLTRPPRQHFLEHVHVAGSNEGAFVQQISNIDIVSMDHLQLHVAVLLGVKCRPISLVKLPAAVN